MSQPLYNTIGNNYNATRTADAFLASRLHHHVATKLGDTFLDLGCGTGNYTIALANHGLEMYGLDPSEAMLKMARIRNPSIRWERGVAEQIPFQDGSFSGITGVLTLHHWKDLNAAFGELKRVLKKNGKIVLFTSSPEQMRGYWLNHYFPIMMQDSMEQMPATEKIAASAMSAGLEITEIEPYSIHEKLTDHFLYTGKNKPEQYLSETIRSGISSFAALANRNEVTAGLQQLKTDIENGKWKSIRDSYQNSNGDYMFVVLSPKSNTSTPGG